MTSYLVAFGLALAIGALLTPLVRNISLRFKLYDVPDGRRVHDRVIPRTGGIAIAIAFLAPVIGIAMTQAKEGEIVYQNADYMLGIILGGVFTMLVGLMDDMRGLGARKKFLLQGLVATFAFVMGFRIDAVSLPFAAAIPMGMLSYFITVIWIVGIINAVNLIDGLDGLAGGIAFFVLVFNFALGYWNHSVLACLIAAALAGAVLGFLIYNFNPASIFMGDAGSMFIGYVLALGAINSGQKSATTVAMLTPIVAMGIPIMDTLFSMIRRFLENRSMFAADRGHIHHRLLDMGLTHRRSVFILYGFTVLLIGVALLIHLGRNWEVGIGLILVVATFAVFARVVGVFEYFNRRRLARIGMLSHHADRLRRAMYDALMGADGVKTPDDVRAFLEFLCRKVQFKSSEVTLNNGVTSSFENPDYVKDKRKHPICATIPLQVPDGQELGRLTVCWLSERGRVTSETEIMLQVIADRLSVRLEKSEP